MSSPFLVFVHKDGVVNLHSWVTDFGISSSINSQVLDFLAKTFQMFFCNH